MRAPQIVPEATLAHSDAPYTNNHGGVLNEDAPPNQTSAKARVYGASNLLDNYAAHDGLGPARNWTQPGNLLSPRNRHMHSRDPAFTLADTAATVGALEEAHAARALEMVRGAGEIPAGAGAPPAAASAEAHSAPKDAR